MKLRCLSATIVAALLTAISVFFANIAHTEYKSQVKKHKTRRISKNIENSITTTNKQVEENRNVELV